MRKNNGRQKKKRRHETQEKRKNRIGDGELERLENINFRSTKRICIPEEGAKMKNRVFT